MFFVLSGGDIIVGFLGGDDVVWCVGSHDVLFLEVMIFFCTFWW